MADNVTDGAANTFATDDIGGVHYPIEKLAFGALDSQTLVSGVNPLPVTLGGSTSIDHGANLDVDAAAEKLTTVAYAARHGIWLKASPANTGTIFVGNSDVTNGITTTTVGYPLYAGNEHFVAVNVVSSIYVIASVANQSIYWRGE